MGREDVIKKGLKEIRNLRGKLRNGALDRFGGGAGCGSILASGALSSSKLIQVIAVV